MAERRKSNSTAMSESFYFFLRFAQSNSDVWTSEQIELDRSSGKLWPDASVITIANEIHRT